MPQELNPPLAAIRYAPEDDICALMAQTAQALTALGVKLGGVLQHEGRAGSDGPCMTMENLATGEHFSLSLDSDSGIDTCRLNPASLAHAATLIRSTIASGTDLVMINKFGAQEAAGVGLRDEMGLAALADLPLLTTVADHLLDDWHTFTGGASVIIEPRLDNILDWWHSTRTASPD